MMAEQLGDQGLCGQEDPGPGESGPHRAQSRGGQNRVSKPVDGTHEERFRQALLHPE